MKQGIVAIIQNTEGKFLLGKRSPHKKIAPLYWTPVTGLMEPDESEEDTIVRECLEEIGCSVLPLEKITSTQAEKGDNFLLHFWRVQITDGEVRLSTSEFTDLGWYSLAEAKLLQPIFDSHLKIIENYFSQQGHR